MLYTSKGASATYLAVDRITSYLAHVTTSYKKHVEPAPTFSTYVLVTPAAPPLRHLTVPEARPRTPAMAHHWPGLTHG